ncbi:hypothetical protein Sjap_000669 [Stephania japonica]|uniref:Uncharacterized protein n=1 Tax=Stephania japonica TaxID=461633 RepID=A0AAP0PSQ6_9MAGN
MVAHRHSHPIGIPRPSRPLSPSEYGLLSSDEDEKEMVPPHVMVERRVRKMGLLVCTGNGMALKGRQLSQVRNSVLRMTGFLEHVEYSSINGSSKAIEIKLN